MVLVENGKEVFMLPLKKGQEVVIKNPGELIGTVVRARPGNKGLPEEQKVYRVQIIERWYKRTALEPVQQPSDVLKPSSPEWLAELHRCLESGQRWIANQNDSAAWGQFVASGAKLGIIIPIK
jgi:hypothetical protein